MAEETLKNVVPHSVATAFARSVLPVPNNYVNLRITKIHWNRLEYAQNIETLWLFTNCSDHSKNVEELGFRVCLSFVLFFVFHTNNHRNGLSDISYRSHFSRDSNDSKKF